MLEVWDTSWETIVLHKYEDFRIEPAVKTHPVKNVNNCSEYNQILGSDLRALPLISCGNHPDLATQARSLQILTQTAKNNARLGFRRPINLNI